MRRRWWLGAALLLAAGCGSPTEQELAVQRAVDQARERNAAVGAAVALLLTLALRHVVFARAADKTARRAARGLPGPAAVGHRRFPPWLVVSAVVTELVCDLVLLGGGAITGWVLGPTPYEDQLAENEFLFVVVALFVLPLAAALVALAMLVQGVAARLPYLGTAGLVWLGVPHALLAAYAVSGLFSDAPDRATALLPLAVGLVGAGGFWYEAYARRRAAAAPPRPPLGDGPRPW